MMPDGSQNTCLTCTPPAGPPAGVHKGNPVWHPSGQFIVFQAEMAVHAGGTSPFAYSEPGRGWWNNIWAMTSDAKQFFQLTNYSSTQVSGVLYPRLSRDGSKLLWVELIAPPSAPNSGVFGKWQVHVADFVISGATPSLANIQTFAPGNGIFFESQDWSADGNSILFASDIGQSTPYAFNDFVFDVSTQTLTNLTNTNNQWNEQARFSNSGNKISFMSSRNNPSFNSQNLSTLQTEFFLMKADGTQAVQLTHFNTAGYAESTQELSAATYSTWSPSGSQLIAEQQLLQQSYTTAKKGRFWVITFAGACGLQ
jgi:Tol biopolymer transport system component